MNDRTLRMIVRDENNKTYKTFKKDLKDIFITRKEYYEDQGRPHTGHNNKEKAMFWGKIMALITSLTTLIGLGIAVLSSIVSR